LLAEQATLFGGDDLAIQRPQQLQRAKRLSLADEDRGFCHLREILSAPARTFARLRHQRSRAIEIATLHFDPGEVDTRDASTTVVGVTLQKCFQPRLQSPA
jgi:hypothetical protein